MRLDRPIYRGLPACRGRSDEEIDQLTKQVYRRKPRLGVYQLLAWLLLFPLVMWIPRPLAEWLGVDTVWSLLITGIVFFTPIVMYETVIHRPAVNREMEAIIAESAPTNGRPAMQSDRTGATEGRHR